MSLFRTPPPNDDGQTDDRHQEAAPVPAIAPAAGSLDYALFEPEEPSGGQIWKRTRRVGWELVQTLALAAIIFFAVRAMAQNFRVEGSSMEPSLHDGQYLLVNKAVYFKINLDTLSKYIPFVDPGDKPQRFLFRAPKRGDVIVFRFPRDPDRDFIKRVIGVPGDRVQITDGVVMVNGVRLEEDYTNPGKYDMEEKVVPNGSYFVLGDNRNNSFNSHVWDFLPEENIIGQAMVTYWPLSDFGGVGNQTIDLGIVRVPVPW